jgi:hypothetical protein
MSRTKLALDVVQDLRSLADSIETLANAALGDDAYVDSPDGGTAPGNPTNAQTADKQPAGQTAPPPNAPSSKQAATQPKQPESGRVAGQSQVSAPDQPPKPLSMVELRAYVSSRTTSENRGTIRSILIKHGVNKLTELPEDQYEVIWNEVASL